MCNLLLTTRRETLKKTKGRGRNSDRDQNKTLAVSLGEATGARAEKSGKSGKSGKGVRLNNRQQETRIIEFRELLAKLPGAPRGFLDKGLPRGTLGRILEMPRSDWLNAADKLLHEEQPGWDEKPYEFRVWMRSRQAAFMPCQGMELNGAPCDKELVVSFDGLQKVGFKMNLCADCSTQEEEATSYQDMAEKAVKQAQGLLKKRKASAARVARNSEVAQLVKKLRGELRKLAKQVTSHAGSLSTEDLELAMDRIEEIARILNDPQGYLDNQNKEVPEIAVVPEEVKVVDAVVQETADDINAETAALEAETAAIEAELN